MNEESKGSLYALASGFFFMCVVLVGKKLLVALTPLNYTFLFYTAGTVWYAVYFFLRRDWKAFAPSRASALAGLSVAVLDCGMILTFNMSLRLISPVMQGFLNNLTVVVGTLLGIVVLRERYNLRELGGILLSLAGLAVMTARTDAIVLNGLWFMLASAAFSSMSAIQMRRFTRIHTPIHLSFHRCTAVFIFMFPILLLTSKLHLPATRDLWLLLALSGFVGPFMNYIMYLNALKRLEVGRVVIIRMSYPLMLVPTTYLLFHQLPSLRQILGGVALFIGVVIMAREKSRLAAPITPIMSTAVGAKAK